MKVETVRVDSAIDWSPHHNAFVNPYSGCPHGCPFCYWTSYPDWEGRIQIRANIPELLEEQLKDWNKGDYIFLGSLCDPFMELEREYQLTRKCLELIRRYEIPMLMTTSAANQVIFRDIDILKGMKQRAIIVVELSRIGFVEEMNRGGKHIGIENANRLTDLGLKVWATLAPILPGITNLEAVLNALNPDIPVYIDCLQCAQGSIQEKRVMEWINRDYPELTSLYYRIMKNQDNRYFSELLYRYQNNPRVLKFPYNL